jgi:hypothetical protein
MVAVGVRVMASTDKTPLEGPLDPEEVRKAVLGLAGAMAAADDQAQAMTDQELGELLLSGRWTTVEVHEAGRRLSSCARSRLGEVEGCADDSTPQTGGPQSSALSEEAD